MENNSKMSSTGKINILKLKRLTQIFLKIDL